MVWQRLWRIGSIQKSSNAVSNHARCIAQRRNTIYITTTPLLWLIGLFFSAQILFAQTTQPQITHIPIPQVATPQNPSAQAPQAPTSTYPTMPTMPVQDEEKGQIAPSKLLQDLITDSLRRKMILHSSCMAEKLTADSFGIEEVLQLGTPLYLTPIQYQDNILRLRQLQLKYANKEAQKQFVLSQALKNVRIVLDFQIKGASQHKIALSPQYIQIDGILLEGTPQIFQAFQAYFCHAFTLKE